VRKLGKNKYFDSRKNVIIKKRTKRAVIYFFIVLGIIIPMFSTFNLVSATESSETKYTINIEQTYANEESEEVYYIEASSHYNYGKQAANRFPYQLAENISGTMSSEEEEEIENIFDNLSEDFQDEIEGFADEFDITPVKALFLLRAYVSYLPINDGCTTTLSTKDATLSGDKTYLTQNIDIHKDYVIRARIFHRIPWIVKITLPSFYKYAVFGLPLIYEIPIINEEGLGFGGNLIRLKESGEIDNGTGWPTYCLECLAIRTCDNVYEVRDVFKNRNRASGLDENYERKKYPHHIDSEVTVWCDDNDGIVMIEQMHEYFNAVFEHPDKPSKKYVLWHANHHQWNTEPTGSVTTGEYKSSDHRAERSKTIVESNYYLITKDKCEDITKDHRSGDPSTGDSYDICRHDDGNDDGNTAVAWITDPKDLKVYFCGGQPCQTETYKEWDYGEKFNVFDFDAEQFESSFSTYTYNYYFQNGAIPYLYNRLENEDYFLDEFNDDEYKSNLVFCSYLSDMMMISSNKQAAHDYTLTMTKDVDLNNEQLPNMTFIANGVVNSSLECDDSENLTWTTIQKAVDNLSALDILVVEQGNYSGNIVLDKSLIIFGADKDNVILDGSVTMSNPRDYELVNVTDQFASVNMTGVNVIFHFNNDTRVGENYSNSTLVFDYSGLENNGTIHNASLTTSTVKGAGALDFNGADSSVNLSSITALSGENVTVSSWINMNNSSGIAGPVVSQSNATNGYCLYVNNTSLKPVFRLDTTEVESSTNISGGWHNIVGTHDNTTLCIYVDGVLKGSTSKTGSGASLDAYIGFDNISTWFNGTIDEVAVWNRTLTGDEILHIYDQHYGVVLDGFTIKNSTIGIQPVNHTDITNCVLINHTTGILIDNTSDVKVKCNFTQCETSLKINNSKPDENNRIRIVDCNIINNTNGTIINASSNIDIVRTHMNSTNTPLMINNSNFSHINITDTWADGNESPDPSNLTGVTKGDINTNYTFYSCTNDSDNDIIFYFFDWGDGNDTGWLGPYDSNVTVNASHSWTEQGGYYIREKTKDIFYNESTVMTLLFKTETYPPHIHSVSNTTGYFEPGGNITITVNVTEDKDHNWSGLKNVNLNVTYPDNSTFNRTMKNVENDTFTYDFDDTWDVGQYNYTIWAVDNAYNTNSSTGHSFNVSAQANMSISTIQDDYGENQTLNLTDPPSNPPLIGYELLDNDTVLHVWNQFDSYYFNTSNGVQFTNHKDNYWSRNVLMLGYHDNDTWNLIYRTDELNNFTKNITSDDETYVNITIWKNLTYQGYDFRLAARYHLGVDDNELTVIPYIKNIDDQDIPYTLGFAWELKDIQVNNTPAGDYIEINGTSYYLNTTVNETYTDMVSPCYYIMENTTDNSQEALYLRWNNSLDYKVKVESRTGQYNAPVTLGIKIGTLNVGQEKQTKMYWHDASQTTYYFDDYYYRDTWASNPGNMVDGDTGNYASTSVGGDVERCDNNTCQGIDYGTISKTEMRAYGYYNSNQKDIILTPVFNGTTNGEEYIFETTTTPGWSQWFNITDDDNKSVESWDWDDVKLLDCLAEAESGGGFWFLYCSKIELRVTYTPYPSEIQDPNPDDGAIGVTITPTLNITVNDKDGNQMNITWYTNCSGPTWQVFGTNNSVNNGTYYQEFANATENGKWWYWKVKVTNTMGGVNWSDVFKFYTGYESKIDNVGGTNIKGYLLIQVQFYNTTLESWILANDTVNETTMRTINSSDVLGLDTIFNGQVNTSDLLGLFGDGTYRVYAAFRDPDGDVLVCDDESLLEASYEFAITSS
jgi:hypothetical protein